MAKPSAKRPPAPAAGFSPAEMAALEAQKKRSGARTPGAVLDAFFPGRLDVAGLTLRPLSLGDFILLEKLDSPILEIEGAEEAEVSAQDFARAIYLLATPFAQVAEEFATSREKFDASALAFAARLPAGEIFAVGAKIRAAIAAGFATAIPGQKKTAPATPASAGL